MLAGASTAAVTTPVLVGLVVGAALAIRFNRPLARAHVAFFKGSREPPRWWQMVLLRSVWVLAGAGVLIVALLALAGVVDL